MLPFTLPAGAEFGLETDDWVWLPGIRKAVEGGAESVRAVFIAKDGGAREAELLLKGLSPEERRILLAGCLMNAYAQRAG